MLLLFSVFFGGTSQPTPYTLHATGVEMMCAFARILTTLSRTLFLDTKWQRRSRVHHGSACAPFSDPEKGQEILTNTCVARSERYGIGKRSTVCMVCISK